MKKISCGTLIVRESKGFKELFMAHVTNKPFWDIPKGGKNGNESYIEAALREMKEEVGFQCIKENLIDLGKFDYTDRKDLYLFKYIGKDEYRLEDAICTSTFFSKIYQTRLPEVDDFKYVPFDDVLSHCSEGFKNVFPLLIKNKIL